MKKFGKMLTAAALAVSCLAISIPGYAAYSLNEEVKALYERLQSMYEYMQQTIDTKDVETAIFEYEDCVSNEDYSAWYKKYSYFL